MRSLILFRFCHQVNNTEIDMGEEEKVPNPESFFEDEEDPDEYMKAYDKLKSDIRKIEQNGRSIQKLSERYNSSTEKQQNQGLLMRNCVCFLLVTPPCQS